MPLFFKRQLHIGCNISSLFLTVASPWKTVKTAKKNGSLDLPVKMENFKAWSSTAMQCTKQAIEEKLGTTSPTRDPEIEAKIEDVK